MGLRSENAAHRVAVEWDEGDEGDEVKRGVYVLRRDTNSRLNAVAGGYLGVGVARRLGRTWLRAAVIAYGLVVVVLLLIT